MKKHTLSFIFTMLSLAVFAQHNYDNQGVLFSHGGNAHVTVGTSSLSGTYTNQQSVFQLLNTDGAIMNLGMTNDPLHRLFVSFTPFGNGFYIDQNASFSFVGGQNIMKFNGSGVNGGSVSIGTNNTPSGFKLAVNGKIIAKEIKVETGWSDFVFYNDYYLPTLEEVEEHIKEKGHLKDIPSAKEVEENGILLGEMDSKLLQKIEELTLYMIELNKEVKELKEENKKLKALLEK